MLFWYFLSNIDGNKSKQNIHTLTDKIETSQSNLIGKVPYYPSWEESVQWTDYLIDKNF